MAMEISSYYSNYVNSYTNTANSKNQTAEKTENTKETAGTGRKTAKDELSYLSEKYENHTFVAAEYKQGMRYGSISTTNIAISPQFLKKMANDPELEKEYESYFRHMRELDEENIRSHAARGRRMVAQGWAIDKDGGISRWGISEPTNKRHYGQEMTDYANKIRKEKAEKKQEQEKLEKRKDSVLKGLQEKYSNFDITSGILSKNQMSSRSKGFQGVMIHPAYLSKAESDERTAKDLDEMLSGVESAQKWLSDAFRRDGLELVSGGYYIDENGNMSSWSLVKKRDSMFDGLAEQSKKTEERLEKQREKVKEQKKTEEKKAEEEKKEKLQGQKVDWRI